MVAPTMSTDEFKRLIARLIECGVSRLLFTGGEPLMRPDASGAGAVCALTERNGESRDVDECDPDH